MDVAQVTVLIGGHPNTARAHLEGLVEQRLATRTPHATGRRGRPRIAYEPTVQGRLAVGPGGVEELVEAVARYLAGTGADPMVPAVALGEIWGSLLAGRTGPADSPDVTGRLVSLLEYAGFSPKPDPEADGRSVALRSCPFLDSARTHPQVVCEIHRGMVMGALTAYGQRGDHVGLHPFSEPGACRLRIEAASP